MNVPDDLVHSIVKLWWVLLALIVVGSKSAVGAVVATALRASLLRLTVGALTR